MRQWLVMLGPVPEVPPWGDWPHTVNAYYSPTENQMVFLAAILQSLASIAGSRRACAWPRAGEAASAKSPGLRASVSVRGRQSHGVARGRAGENHEIN